MEAGNYFPKEPSLALPVAAAEEITTPALADGWNGLPPVLTLTEATGAPPGWGRVWQFAFRAALAPRAPAAVA